MHDYPYPLPPGVVEPITSDDLPLFNEVLPPDTEGLGQQLECLDLIGRGMGRKAYYIDTIFDPWVRLRKLVGVRKMAEFKNDHPDELKSALEGIAHTMAGYVREALRRGMNGVFYSAGMASRDRMSDADYAEFCEPYDRIVLGAAVGAKLNILHIHGNNVRFECFNDYPVQVFSWAGQRSTPSLADARGVTTRALMSGVEESTASNVEPEDIRKQVRESVEIMGAEATIVAPGCAVPPNTPAENIMAIRQAVEELAR
jgi:uroporphyrinogen decarboxylase